MAFKLQILRGPWQIFFAIPSMYGLWYIYLHLVDFYGFHVGKYNSPMDMMGWVIPYPNRPFEVDRVFFKCKITKS